jgi:hypothetical protein
MKLAHSDAPGDSRLARPRRCGVPKLRYNEFGEPILNSFYLLQRFTFLKIIFSYRIILLFPSNILKKLVVKMTLYPNFLAARTHTQPPLSIR